MVEKVYNIAKYSDLSRRSKVEDVLETAHAMNKLIHGLDDVMELERPNDMGAGAILRRKKIKQESNNPNNFSTQATNRIGRILDNAIDRSISAKEASKARLEKEKPYKQLVQRVEMGNAWMDFPIKHPYIMPEFRAEPEPVLV